MKRLVAVLLLLSVGVLRAQSVLTGTMLNPDGSGFTGRLIFSLAQTGSVSIISPCEGPALLVPVASVTVQVQNGVLVSPPTLTSSSCTQPLSIPYDVTAIDMNGNVLFTDQWLITGNPFDIGTAVSVNGTSGGGGSGGSVGSSAWGKILGTLSNQSDLWTALNARLPNSNPVFSGTLTGPAASISGTGTFGGLVVPCPSGTSCGPGGVAFPYNAGTPPSLPVDSVSILGPLSTVSQPYAIFLPNAASSGFMRMSAPSNQVGSIYGVQASLVGISASDTGPNAYAVDEGTDGTSTYVVNPAQPLVSLTAGAMVAFSPKTNNPAAPGITSVNVSGLGAKPILKLGHTVLVSGDITADTPAFMLYDGVEWELLNPQLVSSLGQGSWPDITDVMGTVTMNNTSSSGTTLNSLLSWVNSIGVNGIAGSFTTATAAGVTLSSTIVGSDLGILITNPQGVSIYLSGLYDVTSGQTSAAPTATNSSGSLFIDLTPEPVKFGTPNIDDIVTGSLAIGSYSFSATNTYTTLNVGTGTSSSSSVAVNIGNYAAAYAGASSNTSIWGELKIMGIKDAVPFAALDVKGNFIYTNVPILLQSTTTMLFTNGQVSSTFTAKAAAGTSPGTPVCVLACDNLSGTIDLTTGTSTAAGDLLDIHFGIIGGSVQFPTCSVSVYLLASPYTPLPVRATYFKDPDANYDVTLSVNVGTAPTAGTAYEVVYSGCSGWL
jgi:hypothetical protein